MKNTKKNKTVYRYSGVAAKVVHPDRHLPAELTVAGRGFRLWITAPDLPEEWKSAPINVDVTFHSSPKIR